jgi:hypothetical protein
MKRRHGVSSFARCAGLLLAGLALASAAAAQNPARALVTDPVDESRTVTLRGTVHPLAQAQFEQGAVADSFPANRMLLMLNRPPEREAALQQFLAEAHTQGTASFHKWLTPEQFGAQFGPADSDVAIASQWLASHGFRVARVTKGKSLVEFSGTAANVREAFHTEIHQYSINGETHYANASELAIPEALAPLVRGVSPINNFFAKPYLHNAGRAAYTRPGGKGVPQFTLNGGTFFAIGPEDFATQYDVGPLYSAGVTGEGQTIGILGESNIDIALANSYRQLFALSNNPPQVVIDGNDPGIEPLPGSDIEAYLDVELSGAVAPDATVILYTSDGSDIEDPIDLSILRAVDDNQASVLSLSMGECEVDLGFGNGFWSEMWEEAAAQGQTVLVATGDSGSAGCDYDFESEAAQGLNINGIASTPWNVAVGGTDFYYSNYASGISAAAPFWNQTNDANNGSLKAPLPEQPWDAPFGLNIVPHTSSVLAGGGGASSCGIVTSNSAPCAPYPKPPWQAAPGVPSDGVRDVPDVSLFAAAGENGSAYPICAEEGECAGPQSQILIVGGTSASTPAMAGIMALVDQKYGRQGQADFTLYALARQQPSVFHDITTGNNNVPCEQGSPNCSLDTDGDGLYSLQEYPATTGYDLATGLGSLDANALVTNWNQVSFLGTTTTLTLSQTNFVHGTPILVTASVAGSGSDAGTPTGNVTLVTPDSIPLDQFSWTLHLANGSASQYQTILPGGTYQVEAQYSGDGTFAPSTSAPLNVTVTPESSSILFLDYAPSGTVLNQGANYGYGQRWIWDAEVEEANGDNGGAGSGTMTFTVGANSQTIPINTRGEGAYSPPPSMLPVGTENLTISYSGDASYQPSTAGPFTFTITPGNPIVYIPQVQTSVPVGGNLLVDVVLGTGFGTPPTGNVNVTLGSTTVTAPLVTSDNYAGFPHAIATANLSNLQAAGSFTLSANYAGDSNWAAGSYTYSTPIVVASSTRAASTTTLAISPASITRYQSTGFTATVQSASGTGPAPTGTVIFYVNGQALPGGLSPGIGSSSTAIPSGPVPALVLASGSNQVIASYSGDANYNPSASAPGTVNVDLGTFSLSLGQPVVLVSAGKSGSVPVVINGASGFNTAVALVCAASDTNFTCGVNPSNPMVNGATTATLTVNAYTVSNSLLVTREGKRSPGAPAGLVAALALLFVVTLLVLAGRAPLRLRWSFAIFAFALLLLASACGGGSSPSSGPPPPPPPPPQNTPTPTGSYSVLVTASANGTVHNVRLTVIVQ